MMSLVQHKNIQHRKTLSKTTFCITIKNATLAINNIQYNGSVLSFMLNVANNFFILSIVIPNVFMLSVVMPNVITLSVVTSICQIAFYLMHFN